MNVGLNNVLAHNQQVILQTNNDQFNIYLVNERID